MHKHYSEIFNHNCDFKVKYCLFDVEEGGRYALPNQGIRFDFSYDDPEPEGNLGHLYMIWPEFEDENGEIINDGQVLKEGIARMWIISPEFREFHRKHIKIGTKGHLREGKKIASCEVIEIIDLFINPTSKSLN
jgi:hypothetical protein